MNSLIWSLMVASTLTLVYNVSKYMQQMIFQGSYREVWVIFKDFSRTSQDYFTVFKDQNLGKILIQVLKFFFKLARLR